MRYPALLSLLALTSLGCHARPAVFTSDAIFTATCAAIGGAKRLGTQPGKLVISVDTEAGFVRGATGRSAVTRVPGKPSDGDGAVRTATRIELEIDPATVHCEGNHPAPQLTLDTNTGEITTGLPGVTP
jgi:hypothetical protein